MKASRLLIPLLLSGLSLFASADELTADKRANIEQLLQATNTMALATQFGQNASKHATEMLHQLRPDIPQHVIDMLPGEVMAVFAENSGELQEMMIDIYHQHLSDEEIRELLTFYSSDIGRKIIRLMPAMAAQSMQVGQQWGESLGPQIEARIKARLQQQGIEG
ncbi:DUF2059 domain-containing protein [Ectopseudomonas khazarica]|uniref:DUF2059 domain-containing protein n=1 Tax=Ectopseudomonas khazarica TaxID=2502979 RepID=UPI0040335B5C